MILFKLRILFFSIGGEFIKLLHRLKIIIPPYGINKNQYRSQKVVVSFTSYGRRVSSVLPYTIASLLRQTYKPDVLLLWLDSDNWNDNNLPKALKKLQQKGLTICYCEDLRSYKKLIPTLELYPDALIITVDDDIYYKKNMVERLIMEYEKNPDRIISHRAHRIRFDDNGQLMPYNDWEEEVSGVSGQFIFPTGGGGCLYQKRLLHPDICNRNLFSKLAPKADDVWFYFMERLQSTECFVMPYRGYIYLPLDAFYQYFHKEASLASTNCGESQNDVQIRAVMEHYGLTDEDLK